MSELWIELMTYILPEDVISPKNHWRLHEVVLDRGAGNCAYAIGEWDGRPRIGFRWNGTTDSPIGNPQSRGLPTWTMLDRALHEPVIQLLLPESQTRVRRFLDIGLRFDGVSLDNQNSVLLFWDIRNPQPIVAKIECGIIREFMGRPSISDDDCRLLADTNKELLTQIAEAMFFKNQYRKQGNGVRVIEIERSHLESVAGRFSSDVLEVAARARWIE
jgi:hypothetical protein